MSPAPRAVQHGVALLAPRMCSLGEDPCGGSEVVLWQDAAILRSEGISVRVYARAARTGAPVSLISLRTNAPLFTSIEYGGQLLRREPKAVILSYNEPAVAGWAPDRTIARFDWTTPLPRYWNWPPWTSRFRRARYLFPSDSERSIFMERHARIPLRNTVVLPNAVDLHLFRPTRSVTISGHGGSLRVGFAGQWVPGKGIAELLEAWRRVKADFPGAELYLAGGAGLWRNVGQTAYADETAERVRAMEGEGLLQFAGAFPRARMPEFWNSVNVAVVPSLNESFGLVALEALACGVPVVASAAGGLKEIVENGKNGLLVPPGDAAALARAMTTILSNDSLRQRLAHGARPRAESFSLASRSRHLLGLLLDQAGVKRSGDGTATSP